jgi:hypothetical protein
MQRRVSGTYEFRRRLPDRLAGKPVPSHTLKLLRDLINPKTGCLKRELVRSLGTKDPKEAMRRNHREAQRVGILFDEAELAMVGGPANFAITEADLVDISRGVVAALLATDEAEREDGDERRLLQTREQRNQSPNLVSPVRLSQACLCSLSQRHSVIGGWAS